MNLERLSTAFEQSSATNPKLQVSDIKPNIFLMTRSFARSQVEITASACIPIDPQVRIREGSQGGTRVR